MQGYGMKKSNSEGLPPGDNVVNFKPQEPDMMMTDWAESGNPTRYELRATLHTCKRLWQANQDALKSEGCDIKKTQENINILEKNYMVLMEYLTDR
jgi:hypothetical protein